MKQTRTYDDLLKELENLRSQAQEANDMLHAIRTGQIDALVVENEKGHQLYTLKSADQTYRVFIEKMKEGAVTLNKDEIILYSNSQFASLVDLPLSRVTGLPFANFVQRESKEIFDQLIRQGWKSDSKGEVFLLNKNKKPIPFLLSITALQLDEGAALSVILSDLTSQKQIERQLKEQNEQLEEARLHLARMNEDLEDIVEERTRELLLSREHFKFLADNIPVIVWTTDAEGIVDYVNNRWLEYTGLSMEESKMKLNEIIHPDDLDGSVVAWRKAVEDKKEYEYDFRFMRHSDKAWRWHRARAIPFNNPRGNVVAWFGTSIDIDDQVKELEKKDDFIGVASHELKTPLTSLKGYLQLIGGHEKEMPSIANQYMRKANDSLEKLQHLINDLLDVSKIQAGKLNFSTEIIDLGDIINTSIENSHHIYPSLEIKKETGNGIWVKGNAERLEQVLMNLINNAVKYSPGKNEISIRTETDIDTVNVYVIDSGIGLSEISQKRIFERFYRVEDHQSFTSGLGIGLYISSQIIEGHNGTMAVKSKLNQGSSFSFALPLVEKQP